MLMLWCLLAGPPDDLGLRFEAPKERTSAAPAHVDAELDEAGPAYDDYGVEWGRGSSEGSLAGVLTEGLFEEWERGSREGSPSKAAEQHSTDLDPKLVEVLHDPNARENLMQELTLELLRRGATDIVQNLPPLNRSVPMAPHHFPLAQAPPSERTCTCTPPACCSAFIVSSRLSSEQTHAKLFFIKCNSRLPPQVARSMAHIWS
eukprot:1157221-Pelagomonas_calceolata.AAC.2